jgi:hypothetical protein
MELTKERLEQLANFRGAPVTRQEEQELARIALASLEAEPVAWRYRHHNGLALSNWRFVDSEDECNMAPNYQRQALYTAPPAPVLPEDISGIIERFQHQADHLSEWHHIDEHSCKVNRRDLMTALEFMNACRTAILSTDRK